jgi:hypothetical protein
MLMHERLREVLHYDAETGEFRWIVAAGPRAKIGAIAGSFDKNGYRVIRIDGRAYKAHRLARFYITGAWPPAQIDHADLDKTNNRFSNLREATGSQNQWNQRAYSNNKSGLKGVSWDKQHSKWLAQIKVYGKVRHLGRFTTPEAAHAAYVAAAAEHFSEFSRAG